jgi:hypothetical protein
MYFINKLTYSSLYRPKITDKKHYAVFIQKLYETFGNIDNISEHYITTTNNDILYSLYINNPTKQNCTIVMYDTNENICDMVPSIEMLYNYSSIFLYDYRTYGLSYSSCNLTEEIMLKDAHIIWSYVINNLNYNARHINIWGKGLGGSIGILLCKKISNEYSHIYYPNSLVLNNVDLSSKIIAKKYYDEHFGSLFGYILPLLSFTSYDNDKNINEVNLITKVTICNPNKNLNIMKNKNYKKLELKMSGNNIIVDNDYSNMMSETVETLE